MSSGIIPGNVTELQLYYCMIFIESQLFLIFASTQPFGMAQSLAAIPSDP
jgi:hypothetical protein